MVYAELPTHCSRRLTFYLAMEEQIARQYVMEEGVFFMWQVDPTVICGRHQDVALEVDLDYCRRNNIDVVRRKSGGGCVFADRSNIMFSYITPDYDVTTTFSRYTTMVAEMLRRLGLDASATSRNDVLIGDRKVSGNAFYHANGCSIVHGTMLFATDFTHITHAITPSRAKLESKGVKSVESRITTISSHLDISIEEFMAHCRQTLCGNSAIMLTAADVAAINELEQQYYREGWLMRAPKAGKRNSVRIDGIGEICPYVTLRPDGTINAVELRGDFFSIGAGPEEALRRLHGVSNDPRSVAEALAETDMSRHIAGLSTDKLISIIYQ